MRIVCEQFLINDYLIPKRAEIVSHVTKGREREKVREMKWFVWNDYNR